MMAYLGQFCFTICGSKELSNQHDDPLRQILCLDQQDVFWQFNIFLDGVHMDCKSLYLNLI